MTMVEEMIISGFISKITSEVVDVPLNPFRNAIMDADKNRRDKKQSIETRIYQVIIDSINKFTDDKYEGQETLYDAAESIINGFKSRDKIEAVRMGLRMFASQVTSETCEDFLKMLHHEICIDKNDILYKEIILHKGEQTLETMSEGFAVSNRNDEETHEKLNHVIEGINSIDKKIDGIENVETKHYKMPVINRVDEYAQRWNKNVFLNDFNVEDENVGTEIKLSEIYKEECLPHYIWRTNKQSKDTLRNFLTKYVISINDKKMLLILGQPGIGKSTLITWIMANLVEKKNDILVYQFASDLNNINWQSDSILDEIFATIDSGYNELEGKTLILDGFDEIYMKGDRERILHKMNQELEKKNYLKKISLIITCRENYVDKLDLREIEYITLQAWDEMQIQKFCEVYEEVIARKKLQTEANNKSEIKINRIIEKKDIMGIPLILYMVLALNVDIGRSSSTVEIYDQIFSLKRGGIYDRGYDVEHRINASEIKKHIHHISQQIAFWMFENNADRATISQEKFEEICENEMRESGEKGESIQRDTLIGNFFKINHCEGKGTDELQFVHRSIYEYFVVVYFYESIYKLKSMEEVAGKLGELLKNGHLSKQILEFIKYKFDDMNGLDLSDVIKVIFNIMLRDGMTYHAKGKYKNIIIREMNIFSNMLNIVYLWHDYLENIDRKIVVYLQHNHLTKLNLIGVNLSETNLRGVYLIGVNLSKANLSGADLSGANLSGANLSGANLSGADLSKANLSGAFLVEANLSEANLSEANLGRANLSGTKLRGAGLRKAYLVGSSLREADLRESDLVGTNLRKADLGKAVFDEEQIDWLCEKYDLGGSKVCLSAIKEVISYNEYRMGK